MNIPSVEQVLALSAFVALAATVSAVEFRSHPPTRPIPDPPARPLAEGPAYFVDAAKGNDTHDGAEATPWRSINHGLKQLRAGDTLLLRGGTYFENVYCAIAGTAEEPITIRAYPGERVTIDGGIPDFQADPAGAWVPAAEGVDGEYISAKPYPNIRDVVGLFGDSNIGLQTYWYAMDLRATNELWIADESLMVKPVYCGPGLFYDKQTGHIHARLAHTHVTLPETEDHVVVNYAGETDPRKLPLVVAPFNSIPLLVDQAMYVRFQDLVIRGGGYVTVDLRFGIGIEFDHCTIFAGSYGIWAKNVGPLKVTNCGIHGMIAPWMFRTENVMYSYSGTTYPPFVGEGPVVQERAGDTRERPKQIRRHISRLPTHAIMATAGGYEFETFYTPHNHDWDISYCEFTDSHDGPYISGRNIFFHHNWVDNMQDDSTYVSSPTPYFSDNVHIYQNLVTTGVGAFGAHARGGPSGDIYIYRNVVDMRRKLQFARPSDKKPQGWVFEGHGGWLVHNADHIIHMEQIHFYHNTVLFKPRHTINSYAAGMIYGFDEQTPRRVFNNLYLYHHPTWYPVPFGSYKRERADLVFDGNLHWNVATGQPPKKDILKMAREHHLSEQNKEQYPPGWAAHSVVADPKVKAAVFDRDAVNDYRVREGSPAIGAGIALPDAYEDPLRPPGGERPDIGAIPFGDEQLQVGIDGRIAAGMVAAP